MYQLATLLMELDPEDEASRLLAADALYRLGRLDDAHKALLVALSRRPQAAPVLVRLALLQLRRGFFYDANQVRSVAPHSAPHHLHSHPGPATSGRSLPSLTLGSCGCPGLAGCHGDWRAEVPRPQQAPRTQKVLRICSCCVMKKRG